MGVELSLNSELPGLDQIPVRFSPDHHGENARVSGDGTSVVRTGRAHKLKSWAISRQPLQRRHFTVKVTQVRKPLLYPLFPQHAFSHLCACSPRDPSHATAHRQPYDSRIRHALPGMVRYVSGSLDGHLEPQLFCTRGVFCVLRHLTAVLTL